MTRSLIVTADDVGLHRGTTLGAVAAHEGGIVTACSVVAVGRELRHAVEVLRGQPGLGVGAHLTLVDGTPLSPPAQVASLVAANGAFLPGFAAFVRRYAAGRVRLDHVEVELRRQIETLLGAGLELTHLNSHQHLHVLPGILRVVLRLAAEYRIGYVRAPVDRHRGGVGLARSLGVRALAGLGRAARRRARACGVTTNDVTIGIAAAGHLDGARMTGLLPLAAGVTELVCHPGRDGRSLAAALGWGYEWEAETAALCDPAMRAALDAACITLVRPPLPGITWSR
ncbi:MAG: ChbG/HpnK family deacetylase [Thermoanaerobaculaceae bacterium]|nr:ChbG/HpnK family deacetylase [Thermoanaerobaculaceae bacterium]